MNKREANNLVTDLEGFEPPTFGLEARRYILAKPQIQPIRLSLHVAAQRIRMNLKEK